MLRRAGIFDDEEEDNTFKVSINKKLKSILFVGDITPESIHKLKQAFQEIHNNFKKNDKDKIIHLNVESNGGCLFSGSGAYDWIMKFKKDNDFKLNTFATGLVASAATLLFMTGDTRDLGFYSYVLIHNMSSSSGIEPQHLEVVRQNYKNDRMLSKNFYKFYKTHCNIPPEKLKELFKKDMYLTYNDCKKFGIITNEEAEEGSDDSSDSDSDSDSDNEVQTKRRRTK